MEVEKKIKDFKNRVKSAGRDPTSVKFSVSMRPIVAETENDAWNLAYSTLSSILDSGEKSMHGLGKERLESVGSKRLTDFAKRGHVLDDRFYMPIAAATA